MILYNNSERVMNFLHEWKESFHKASFKKDQVTLRELIYKSDLRISTLPPEYNIRYKKYIELWDKTEAKPKILHFKSYHNSNKNIKNKNIIKISINKILKTLYNLFK